MDAAQLPTSMDRKHGDHETDPAEGPIRKGHIGLIVAGSIITGFVVALVLVIGPFGGAQEHVIMGTALFGWALGWALLAVLSLRWTDQPQRWAVVPAAVMALAGGSLLIFRPDADAFNVLGWIWPPALIALAVWMTVQSRRNLRSPTRRFMLYPLFVAIVIAGVGGSYETIQEQVDRSATAMPGHLVDVGGRRLYVHCTGSGSPTVVLISGLAEASTYWGGWIAPAVARNTTVCAYDRAGQGWSDPPPSPQGGVAVAIDLHNLAGSRANPGSLCRGRSLDRRRLRKDLRGTLPGSGCRHGHARLAAKRSLHRTAGLPLLLHHDPPSVSTLPITGALRSVSAGQSVHFGSSAGPDS